MRASASAVACLGLFLLGQSLTGEDPYAFAFLLGVALLLIAVTVLLSSFAVGTAATVTRAPPWWA